MADVYLACTQGAGGFQKLLVVKLARFTGDPTFSTMFLDEARLAAQLSHPNVVQTYEIGEEGSRHYIVMEYLDGGNFARLRQKAQKADGISLRMSLAIIIQALDGLEYAHEARGLDGKLLQVVHRDLSPTNIMVTAQGVVKILDFGIAKATDNHSFTQTGRFSGKLNYMPPEQIKGEHVDARADVFAVGVIIAEAVLGEKLWGNASGPTIASQLASGQIPSLDRAKDLDPELRRICDKALAPDREQRYASAAELKADLTKFVATIGGAVSQRELADFVRLTIEDDRGKLQAAIDRQLQRISLLAWGGETPPPDLPRFDHTPSNKLLQTEPNRAVKEELVIEDSGQVQIITSEGAPMNTAPRGRTRTFALIGGAAAIVAAIVIWELRPRHDAAPAPSGAETAVAPVAPAAPAATRLEIVVSPSEAILTLDGHPLGSNPYVGSFPRDLQVHDLVVTAAGYQPLTQRFSLDRDLNFHLSLQRDAPPPPAPVATSDVPATSAPSVAKRPDPVTPRARVRPEPAAIKTARTAPSVPTRPEVINPPGTPAKPADPKHTLDRSVYDNQPTKRTLDSNVLDDKSKPKPTIDRESPWKN